MYTGSDITGSTGLQEGEIEEDLSFGQSCF